MKHELYTLTVTFEVCDGQKDTVLDEIRRLLLFVQQESLGHASGVKTTVEHKEI